MNVLEKRRFMIADPAAEEQRAYVQAAADEESNLKQEGQLPPSAEAENDVRSPPDLATEEQHPVRPLVPGLMETLVGHTNAFESRELLQQIYSTC